MIHLLIHREAVVISSKARPKHQVLSDWLREQLTAGVFSSGQQIPTENELARRFGISRQTVRQAIGALESEGLLSRVRGSGTFVRDAALPRSVRTSQIGVIITYLDDYVFPTIVQGIEQVLTENGYLFTLGITYNKPANEEQCLRQMLEAGVDGLIIEGTKSALPNANLQLLGRLREQGVPAVFINGYYGEPCDSYVILDDVNAGEQLAEQLYQNGHRSIGGIFKSDDLQGVKRYEGVLRASRRLGMTLRDDAVVWYTTEDLPYLLTGSMDEVLLRRLSQVTAAVCYNDQIASGLIGLLGRHGKRVPEDLSLVSVDDSPLAQPAIHNLTSLVYPARKIGELAAQILLCRLSSHKCEEKVKLRSTLVVRESVKTLRDGNEAAE